MCTSLCRSQRYSPSGGAAPWEDSCPWGVTFTINYYKHLAAFLSKATCIELRSKTKTTIVFQPPCRPKPTDGIQAFGDQTPSHYTILPIYKTDKHTQTAHRVTTSTTPLSREQTESAGRSTKDSLVPIHPSTTTGSEALPSRGNGT